MDQSFLQIKNVSKVYMKNGVPVRTALDSVSLTLNRGEIFGLLGVNGAGKTTLVSVISTMHPLSSGDVLWEGKSIYHNLLRYRQIVGFCPQHPNIEHRLCLEENLIFAGACYGLSKEQSILQKNKLLKRFDLEKYARAFSNELSGGYRQRFLIARALVHDPRLVILDEPTVGLDPHIRRQLWEIIADLRSRDITVLLTTHYLDEAEYLSDRVALIHQGTIRTIDTPSNLKKHHEKNNLEEVFLKFIDDPNAAIFNSVYQ